MFVPGLVVRRGLKVSEVAATAQCAVLTEYNETAQRHSEDFVRVASELTNPAGFDAFASSFSSALVSINETLEAAMQAGILSVGTSGAMRETLKALRDRTIDSLADCRDRMLEGVSSSEEHFVAFAQEARNKMQFVSRMIDQVRKEKDALVRVQNATPGMTA